MPALVHTGLQINAQAMAILHLLSSHEVADVGAHYDIPSQTYTYQADVSAWYNGRERGICLIVRESFLSTRCLILTFGEARSSDAIFIDAWEHEGRFLNPPTVADFSDEAYADRRSVPNGEIGTAVNVILDRIRDFLQAQPEASEPPPARRRVVARRAAELPPVKE